MNCILYFAFSYVFFLFLNEILLKFFFSRVKYIYTNIGEKKCFFAKLVYKRMQILQCLLNDDVRFASVSPTSEGWSFI